MIPEGTAPEGHAFRTFPHLWYVAGVTLLTEKPTLGYGCVQNHSASRPPGSPPNVGAFKACRMSWGKSFQQHPLPLLPSPPPLASSFPYSERQQDIEKRDGRRGQKRNVRQSQMKGRKSFFLCLPSSSSLFFYLVLLFLILKRVSKKGRVGDGSPSPLFLSYSLTLFLPVHLKGGKGRAWNHEREGARAVERK